MRKKKVFNILGTVFTIFILAGIFLLPAGPVNAETPQYGGILTIIQKNSPKAIGYPPDVWGADYQSALPALERLAWSDENGNVHPVLAQSWEVTPDKKALILHLRKGVKFHDGTDFNAEAVKYNIELQQHAPKRTGFSGVSSMDVLDDHTLRLNLKKFDISVMSDLAGYYGMASPSSLKKNGKDWARWHPVGTGPFEFVSFKRGAKLVYKKFKGYWQEGKPYLDGMEMLYIKDPMTQAASFQAGEGQLLTFIQPKVAHDFEQKGYRVRAVVSAMRAFCPDLKNDPILADKRVREAIDYAINKKAITGAVGYGYWEPMSQFSPSVRYGYMPGFKGREYDPEKAKQLLAEAGYANGFKTKAIISTRYANRHAMVAIKSDLGKVGIDLTLDMADPGRWAKHRGGGWNGGFLYGLFGAAPNYGYSMYRQLGSRVKRFVSTTRPDGWDAALEQAILAVGDFNREKAFTQKALKIGYDNVMLVPLWASSSLCVMDKSFHSDAYTYHHMFWKPEDGWLSR